MQITTCRSGEEAIKAVNSYYFDLVFMDHMMPGMDGIETTARIRALGSKEVHYKELPIIALTANAVYGTKEMFLENGFNGYLSKPINIVELNAILEKWVPKEKQVLAEGNYENVKVEKRKNNIDIEIDGVDLNRGIALTGGKVDIYLKTLKVFCNDGYVKIKEIGTCLGNGDLSLYTTYVHALKSACASIGASELSEAMELLETAGKNEDMDFIKSNNDKSLEKFEMLLNNIKNAITHYSEEENAVPMEKSSSEQKKEKLTNLKKAIIDMDTITADETLNDLMMETIDREINETLSEITQHILMSDYEEAINMIDILIDNINE
jgi:CheY-like chemotaxis protein